MNPSTAIFEKEYKCYRNGEFICNATFTDDPNLGGSFLNMFVNKKGEVFYEVVLPDNIELIE